MLPDTATIINMDNRGIPAAISVTSTSASVAVKPESAKRQTKKRDQKSKQVCCNHHTQTSKALTKGSNNNQNQHGYDKGK
jgi:hypothetical protein